MTAPRPVPRVVLAAPSSGAGKTTVTAALLAACRQRGLAVAPFKAGPDYIDPTHHAVAAGRASRNLDSWLMPPDMLRALFDRATSGTQHADVAVIEGVMGLFDGREATSDEGSTAALAALLATPVVLVLDASAMARTAAAVVHGLHGFSPTLRLAGVILNRVGGAGHAALCARAIAETTGVPTLGWLPRDPAIAAPERHLGLVLAGEHPMDVARLAAQAEATLDVDGLLAIARTAPPLPAAAPVLPPPVSGVRARIGVARDAAFDFYYEDNLDLLRALGAELVPFSPLDDAALPPALGALYLGGGYPELHAARLAANAPLRAAVRAFADAGRPVYAECGGLMYLAEALIDQDGARHAMVGAIAGISRMQTTLTIGYRDAVALRDSPIARAGQWVRGHAFHYSTLTGVTATTAYRQHDGEATEGVVAGPQANVLASYLHVHFGTDVSLARRFVDHAAAAVHAA